MSTQFFLTSTTLSLMAALSLSYAQMPGGAKPAVLVAPVMSGFDVIERRSIGHTEAIRTVEVQTAIQGYLKEVKVSNGALVKEGDILFLIDPIRYQAEVDQAKATIAELQLRIDYTKKHLARLSELVERQATSKQEAEDYTHQLESLHASMAEAEAMLTLAEKNLADCTIRATISGRVGRIQNAVGNYVTHGTPLATIKQIDPIYVKFPLSQNDVSGVFHGHRGIKNVTDIHLRSADGFIIPAQGKISIIDSQLDAGTDSFTLWAEFDNKDGHLTPAGIGEIIVRLNTRKEVMLVPLTGVRYDSKGAYVLIADENSTIARRDVSVGNVQGSQQTVYDGIEQGDQIVIDGAHKIRVGSQVTAMVHQPTHSDESDDITESQNENKAEEQNEQKKLTDILAPVPVTASAPQLIVDPTVLSSQGARLEAVREVALQAKVEGTLTQIAFTEGHRVKEGDVLFRIDPTRYAATVKAQQAKIQQLDVQIKDAKAKWDRQQYLYQRSATSLNDVDTAKLTHDQLVVQKQAAEAKLVIAQDDLKRCIITAPLSGLIGRIPYTVGSYIKGDNELATLLQMNPIYARFSLSETDILSYYESTRKMQQEAELIVIGATGEKYGSTGRIEFVDNVIQTGTGTQNCWAIFDNPKGTLKPGAVVTIEIRRKPEYKQLAIPAASVRTDSQGHYVYVLRHERAIKTRVIAGSTDKDGLTAIYEGITAQDLVINSNFSMITHDAKVSVAK